MNNIVDNFRKVREIGYDTQDLTSDLRNKVLLDLANLLEDKTDEIEKANQFDLDKMAKNDPKYDRLLLNQERIRGIASDLRKVVSLASPVGQILEEVSRPNGLYLKKVRVPLGVVAVIYEARPNVTIDVFALAFKTANAVVLKGGSEAQHSNQILVSLIHQSLIKNNINPELVYLMPPEREAVHDLLNAVGLIDVCIPRGSQGLIDFVRKNAKIPVIETGAGIVHAYFDKSGDVAKGSSIIHNAKTRRVSVCNALDTLLIHQERLLDLPMLVSNLAEKNVEVYADRESYAVLDGKYPSLLLKHATPESFGTEFLDYKLSIKSVPDLDSAIKHIMNHTSGHSEAIIAEDQAITDKFLRMVDAAAVYVNASTAFTDGGEFGMGAEIGISTQKLHARGPMALPELTSYKWLIYGNGQTR